MEATHEEFDERRKSLRVDMEAERVLVSWTDSNGEPLTDDGICIDLARRGVLIEYKQAFNVGDLVAITFNPDSDKQNQIRGQVCRCNQCHDQSYHIALQII
ncbi:pilus assembly protein PilZ [Shewanella colwelliana]|uniref:Pilus assembly protein PilZ n=1 Tax=Shewanella colwelliana TaxID=23 RepID=A0A1E5INF8_SHECO|nr:PilZ domain-containing protein [Shewanella colwelliana]OEG72025.1 pilus assembly protein PilZ [Shewanella colwelliana]GIU28716.1 pilus assembly protein PilZ [Shewanella colwelliana]GIU39756.1 pilus assembly protein PilZ [Shewanella colwelliana]